MGQQCQQIIAYIFCSKMQALRIDEEWLHQSMLAKLVQHVLCWGLVEFHLLKGCTPNNTPEGHQYNTSFHVRLTLPPEDKAKLDGGGPYEIPQLESTLTRISSRYVEANGSPRKTESISHWKDAGAPVSPNGIQQNW